MSSVCFINVSFARFSCFLPYWMENGSHPVKCPVLVFFVSMYMIQYAFLFQNPSRCSIASKKCNLPFKTPRFSSISSRVRDAAFLSKEIYSLRKAQFFLCFQICLPLRKCSLCVKKECSFKHTSPSLQKQYWFSKVPCAAFLRKCTMYYFLQIFSISWKDIYIYNIVFLESSVVYIDTVNCD